MTKTLKRPRIGITIKAGHENGADVQRYQREVQRAGGEPVLLSLDAATGELPPDLGDLHLDGLLLSGGGDVDPSRYNQPLQGSKWIDAARDELELALTRQALEQDLPILGICRGMQVLNVAAGGQLIQDLPETTHHTRPDQFSSHHEVEVVPGTQLAKVLGETSIAINSRHHQGVDTSTLAPGLIASAQSITDDALFEGIESPRHRFVLGVQWHPERVDVDPFSAPDAQRRLFRAFVRAAKEAGEKDKD